MHPSMLQLLLRRQDGQTASHISPWGFLLYFTLNLCNKPCLTSLSWGLVVIALSWGGSLIPTSSRNSSCPLHGTCSRLLAVLCGHSDMPCWVGMLDLTLHRPLLCSAQLGLRGRQLVRQFWTHSEAENIKWMKREASIQYRPFQFRAFAQQALISALHLHTSGLSRPTSCSKGLPSLTEARGKTLGNYTVTDKRHFVFIFSAGFLLGQWIVPLSKGPKEDCGTT